MKVITKLELKLDNHEKCLTIIDSDCPLGQLYDYSCVLQSFVLQQMKEAKDKQEVKKEEQPEA